MSKEDGGSAFPDAHCDGMSLRDYFAAAALTGIMANPRNKPMTEAMVLCAWQMADIMLEEREEK